MLRELTSLSWNINLNSPGDSFRCHDWLGGQHKLSPSQGNLGSISMPWGPSCYKSLKSPDKACLVQSMRAFCEFCWWSSLESLESPDQTCLVQSVRAFLQILLMSEVIESWLNLAKASSVVNTWALDRACNISIWLSLDSKTKGGSKVHHKNPGLLLSAPQCSRALWAIRALDQHPPL